MRQSKEIDYKAEHIGGEEHMIRLLCSPLYYDKDTHIVSAEAFNLRLLGKDKSKPETYASLGRRKLLEEEGILDDFLQRGYKIWDDKTWETNRYAGHGTFQCSEAININPKRIEINPLTDSDKGHVGLFYVKSENDYYKGPLPVEEAEISEMLSDLANLISDAIVSAPPRHNIDA